MVNKNHSDRRSTGGDCNRSRPKQSNKHQKGGASARKAHHAGLRSRDLSDPQEGLDFYHLFGTLNRSCEKVLGDLQKCGDLDLPLMRFGLDLKDYADKLEVSRRKLSLMQPTKETEANRRLITLAYAMIRQIAKFVAGLHDWQAIRRTA